MDTDILNMILFPTAALFYFQIMNYLDQRYARTKPFTDDEFLWRMARARGCSEYDIFKISARQWHFNQNRVDDDFKRYLIDEQIPHYVRDYVRKNKSEIFKRVPA